MKRIYALAVAVALGISGCVGYSVYRSHAATEGFKQIEVGTSEERVVLLMGKPSAVLRLGDKRFWSSHVPGSIKEYHYEPTLLPEIWVLGFDSEGTVVYRSHNLM